MKPDCIYINSEKQCPILKYKECDEDMEWCLYEKIPEEKKYFSTGWYKYIQSLAFSKKPRK